MDLNVLLQQRQISLLNADQALTPRDKRAYDQFARDYADQIGMVRNALGAGHAPPGSVT